MLSQMPLPPSGNVNDAYFYVEAPWIVRIWNYAKNFDLDKFVPDT